MFENYYVPPDLPECEHVVCDYCSGCHVPGCHLYEPLCEGAGEEIRVVGVSIEVLTVEASFEWGANRALGGDGMRIEDVPPGWLVIAVEVEGKVYCLECADTGEGKPLTENDIAERCGPDGLMYCGACDGLLARQAWMYE